MRIHIHGNSGIVAVLEGQLKKEGHIIGKHWAKVVVELVKGYDELPGGKIKEHPLVFFCAPGELETRVISHFQTLSKDPILLYPGAGNRAIKIQVPLKDEPLIASSVMRALNEIVHIPRWKLWLNK
jgi:hypothetical protein